MKDKNEFKKLLSWRIVLLIITCLGLFTAADGADDIPVVTAPAAQGAHRIICADQGGYFAAWHDRRNNGTSGNDIYVQRFDAVGNNLWAVNGVVVSDANGDQGYPKIISDSAGGCIISWEDEVTGMSGTMAETFAIVEVDGEPLDSVSCSTAPIGTKRSLAGLFLIPLMLLGLGLTRKLR